MVNRLCERRGIFILRIKILDTGTSLDKVSGLIFYTEFSAVDTALMWFEVNSEIMKY